MFTNCCTNSCIWILVRLFLLWAGRQLMLVLWYCSCFCLGMNFITNRKPTNAYLSWASWMVTGDWLRSRPEQGRDQQGQGKSSKMIKSSMKRTQLHLSSLDVLTPLFSVAEGSVAAQARLAHRPVAPQHSTQLQLQLHVFKAKLRTRATQKNERPQILSSL